MLLQSLMSRLIEIIIDCIILKNRFSIFSDTYINILGLSFRKQMFVAIKDTTYEDCSLRKDNETL